MVVMNGSQRSQAPNPKDGESEAPAQNLSVVRFVRASDEHVQPGGIDESNALTSSSRDLGVHDIPAYGFLRNIWLFVEVTGGAAGLATVAAAEDAPWNVLQNISLTEPNGAPIVQLVDGYQLYLVNKYGGYVQGFPGDPQLLPTFSDVDSDGNFSFSLRIPVEVGPRDGLGSLANQDSAGQFKLRLAVAASGTVYDTAPDTLPTTVRVRAYIECWDQPEQAGASGTNQTEPPAVGTTSFWSVQSGRTVNNGQNTIELKRKGNHLRQVLLVLRDAGSRADAEADWPDETRFERDAFPARYYQDDYWSQLMAERTGYIETIETAGGLDNGVRFHDYAHDFNGKLGYETRDLWQPTRGSSRLELVGSWSTGSTSTLDIITNDVAIAQNVFV